ncbi:protein DESIGUAL 2 [Cryptomeria japonica]|uniref:protein DESIGUAL 2 n=1 Tax=Cryptomeria japonica TaxID=3369 RepID=UPI0025AD423F|nr:protein DESIGUAL 2 [Cryptomeria japonica]
MWTKMSKSGTVICSLVGLLGLIAAILGFVAEAKHVRAGEVKMTSSGRCLYPRSPALALGITAAVALLLAQIIVNSVVGCICCLYGNRYPPSSNRTIAVICLVVSWITFAIAFILLMAGAALNDKHNADIRTFGDYCYVVKSGVFAGGAVLALATVTLGIIYFITASAAKSSSECGPQNIAMAQPQYGRSTMQPVFVPEQHPQYGQYSQYSRGSQQPPGPSDNFQRATWR